MEPSQEEMPGPRAETCPARGGEARAGREKALPNLWLRAEASGVRGLESGLWSGREPVCLAAVFRPVGPARPGCHRAGWSFPDLGDVPCPQDAQEFSDVERAIETLIKNFHQYSVEGGKETLTPSELRDLVTQQLPHLMPVLRG